MSAFLGYELHDHQTTAIIDAPCCCPDCDGGVQSGHFACSTPPEDMLQAEKEGLVFRFYESGGWFWATTRKAWETGVVTLNLD